MRTKLLILGTFLFLHVNAQVNFENVSTAAGLTYQGRTYGSSWGDIDGDGYMDLYMSCHQNKAEWFFKNDSIRIYRNMGNGLFDMSIYQLDDGGQSDFHGGIFYDLDNDGDQDMFLVSGGHRKNVLLRNNGTAYLHDIADQANLALNKSRGRQSTCVDANNDGFTDIIVNNEHQNDPMGLGTVLLVAHPGTGYAVDDLSGFNVPFSTFSCIADLNGDGHTDVVTGADNGLNIYSIGAGGQFTLESHLDIPNVTDISIADFNGDLLPDIFVARGLTQETDIQQINGSVIFASVRVSQSRPPSEGTFKTVGPIEVSLLVDHGNPFNLHVGNSKTVNGMLGSPYQPYQIFTLYPGSQVSQGFQDPSLIAQGVNCSFGRTSDNGWKFKIDALHGANTVMMQIKSGNPIINFISSGTPAPDQTSRDLLLLNQGNFQFVESTDPAFNLDEFSISVTSGDLDNDMDNDLIVMSTGNAKNRSAHLYENTGNGTFIVHENGWGIQGVVPGIGNAVTSADYNNDGFLDLFVTNGFTSYFLDSAGVDLYHNMGNSNHWITMDLDGVGSNADGIGAIVEIQAGGVSQIANMTNGIHTASQDDARIHFGLRNTNLVDSIKVTWPSGMVDILSNVPADQILTIVEGSHSVNSPTGPTATPQLKMAKLIGLGLIDHVVIYNVFGQQVDKMPVNDRELLSSDLDLASGIYMLEYVNAEGKVMAMKKLMRQ